MCVKEHRRPAFRRRSASPLGLLTWMFLRASTADHKRTPMPCPPCSRRTTHLGKPIKEQVRETCENLSCGVNLHLRHTWTIQTDRHVSNFVHFSLKMWPIINIPTFLLLVEAIFWSPKFLSSIASRPPDNTIFTTVKRSKRQADVCLLGGVWHWAQKQYNLGTDLRGPKAWAPASNQHRASHQTFRFFSVSCSS